MRALLLAIVAMLAACGPAEPSASTNTSDAGTCTAVDEQHNVSVHVPCDAGTE